MRDPDSEEGWGVIEFPNVPGGCFVHYSNIDMAGATIAALATIPAITSPALRRAELPRQR